MLLSKSVKISWRQSRWDLASVYHVTYAVAISNTKLLNKSILGVVRAYYVTVRTVTYGAELICRVLYTNLYQFAAEIVYRGGLTWGRYDKDDKRFGLTLHANGQPCNLFWNLGKEVWIWVTILTMDKLFSHICCTLHKGRYRFTCKGNVNNALIWLYHCMVIFRVACSCIMPIETISVLYICLFWHVYLILNFSFVDV